jgi:hypothetical protein
MLLFSDDFQYLVSVLVCKFVTHLSGVGEMGPPVLRGRIGNVIGTLNLYSLGFSSMDDIQKGKWQKEGHIRSPMGVFRLLVYE